MRTIDADHLYGRLNLPSNDEEAELFEIFKMILDTEPTVIQEDEEKKITWIPARREKDAKGCHAVTYGVECNRCKGFQFVPSRYCKDCGGRFDGNLDVINKYSERKFGGQNRWRD